MMQTGLPLATSGRIRLDDQTSLELLLILDRELKVADRFRHEAAIRDAHEAAGESNKYMRRIRRLIGEISRMRSEMGWDDIELSELGRRPK